MMAVCSCPLESCGTFLQQRRVGGGGVTRPRTTQRQPATRRAPQAFVAVVMQRGDLANDVSHHLLLGWTSEWGGAAGPGGDTTSGAIAREVHTRNDAAAGRTAYGGRPVERFTSRSKRVATCAMMDLAAHVPGDYTAHMGNGPPAVERGKAQGRRHYRIVI